MAKLVGIDPCWGGWLCFIYLTSPQQVPQHDLIVMILPTGEGSRPAGAPGLSAQLHQRPLQARLQGHHWHQGQPQCVDFGNIHVYGIHCMQQTLSNDLCTVRNILGRFQGLPRRLITLSRLSPVLQCLMYIPILLHQERKVAIEDLSSMMLSCRCKCIRRA